MALTPSNAPEGNQAFLREVDDEYRRDQMTAFWRRWGKVAIGALVAALVLFAGWLYWQHRRTEAAAAEGEQMQAAFDQLGAGQTAQAEPTLDALATSSRAGYRASAIFSQADILLQRNDFKGAAEKFASVANDAGMAQPFRDLALIRQTAAEFDTLPPKTVVDRMRPLAVPGGAYLGSAGEMMAVAQLRLGQGKEAGALFGRIARDENVPSSLRQRAVQMAGVLGVDAVGSGGAGSNGAGDAAATAPADGEAKAK